MISEIAIRNFAIIDQLDLHWKDGFIAITGETGAGKSILFDAIELCLGGRANLDMIRRGESKASIEMSIVLSEDQQRRIAPILDEYDCDCDDLLQIKRVLSVSGRNRIYINGTRVRLDVLRTITDGLIDIIGQHANQVLLATDSHVAIVDRFAGLGNKAAGVCDKVECWRALRREISQLQSQEELRQVRLATYQQQLDDIEMAQIKPEEDIRLSREIAMMLNAELVQENCTEAAFRLSETEGSALDALSSSVSSLRRISHLNPELDNVVEALEKMKIELSELSRDVRFLSEGAIVDPEQLEMLQERLSLIERLKREHGGTIEDVLRAMADIQSKFDGLVAETSRIATAQQEAEALQQDLLQDSRVLSKARQRAAKRMEKTVEEELRCLGMPHCRFQVRFTFSNGEEEVADVEQATSESLSRQGLDNVEYLISPNPGEGFKAMVKVASGGELSRILLALKSALIQTDPVGSYIFDEVDSGIGGGIAETVGQKLQYIGDSRQALCITHLAQVACCAHHHLKVVKRVEGERTTSELRYLSFEERVQEVARMLGGSEITSRTTEHAREMLRLNRPAVARLVG